MDPAARNPARRAVATRLPPTGWHGCRFPLVRQHRTRNGAGKSTAIELLLGLVDADHGSVFLFGSSPGQAIAAGRVGAMLQDTKLMSGVSVGALLRVIRGLYPHPADLLPLIQVAGIDGLLRRRTDQLSVGESQRVRFALAASGDPQLIVLDEPTGNNPRRPARSLPRPHLCARLNLTRQAQPAPALWSWLDTAQLSRRVTVIVHYA